MVLFGTICTIFLSALYLECGFSIRDIYLRDLVGCSWGRRGPTGRTWHRRQAAGPWRRRRCTAGNWSSSTGCCSWWPPSAAPRPAWPALRSSGTPRSCPPAKLRSDNEPFVRERWSHFLFPIRNRGTPFVVGSKKNGCDQNIEMTFKNEIIRSIQSNRFRKYIFQQNQSNQINSTTNRKRYTVHSMWILAYTSKV